MDLPLDAKAWTRYKGHGTAPWSQVPPAGGYKHTETRTNRGLLGLKWNDVTVHLDTEL